MALFVKDPFVELRTATGTGTEAEQLSKPYDTLDATERDNFQEALLDLYNKYAPSELINSDGALGEPTSLETLQWRNIIFHAIAQDTDFQRLVVDERTSPGTHLFSTLMPRLDWLIGVFLPGFYHHFSSFEEGYNKVLKSAMPSLITDSRFIVDYFINEIENDRFSTFAENEEGQKKPPYWSTKSCVSNMFLLCQDEKILDHCRMITYDHLQDLNKMFDMLPNTKRLADRYKDLSSGGDEALIDRFGEIAMQALPPWARLSKTLEAIEVDDDFASQVHNALTDVESTDGAKDEYEAAGSSVPFNPQDQVQVDGINPDTYSFDEPFGLDHLEQKLKNHFSTGSKVFYYPNFQMPTSGRFLFTKRPAHSLSQFDSQEGEPVRKTADGHTLRRADGFKRARMISREMEVDLPQNQAQPSASEILDRCAEYLAKVSSEDNFHKQGFKDMFNSLSDMKTRPKKAQKLKMGATELRGFSDLIMRDNWWHARCLFEAVKVCLMDAVPIKTKSKVKDAMEHAEINIAILVSMIGGGADDPLPWMLVVESQLRATWRKIQLLASMDTSSELRLLFTELVVWVNGTVVNSYVLRCPLRPNNTGTIVEDWYKLLYEYNSACANPDCLRLLPHPDRIDLKWVRGAFSVGTRETRNGRKATRQFISTNRDNAYDCLFYVLRYFKPSPDTIIFIFWYSHLFHNERCKFSRGKHPITAF